MDESADCATHATIAGALLDFFWTLLRELPDGVDATAANRVLHQWAELRGLDLFHSDSTGWVRAIKPRHRLPVQGLPRDPTVP